MSQPNRTLQELRTPLAPDQVLERAEHFFTRQSSLYAAFPDKAGPTFRSFRGQGTEEVVIAVSPIEGGTLVTGSAYLFDMQVARFFTSLPELPATAEQAS